MERSAAALGQTGEVRREGAFAYDSAVDDGAPRLGAAGRADGR